MSFADELRKAPAEKEKEKQLQDDWDWKYFIQLWYWYIKGECRACAASGLTHVNICLSDFIQEISDDGEIYNADGEPRKVKYRERSMFERLQPRIAHYVSDEYVDSLDVDDVFDAKEQIIDLLEADGLTVKGSHSSYESLKRGKRYHLSFDINW